MMTLWPVLVALSAAPGGSVAIVDLDAPELVGLAGQVTRAVVAEAAHQKLTVLPPEAIRTSLGPDKYDELRKCGDKVACASRLLEPTGAVRAVLGALVRDEKSYLLKLWLIDLKKMEVLADVDRPILIAARRFQKDVEQAVPPLLRGEREARGTALLTSNLADAQVSVNGEFLGVAPVTLTRRPGKYQVTVQRKKYLSVTRYVAIEPNQKIEERFTLLLRPGEIPDAEVVPDIVARKKDGGVEHGPAVSLGAPTWIAGALAVAAGGTGLYFGLSSRAGDRALTDRFNPDTGVYAGTRVDAQRVQQEALYANIAFGVAGVAAVATGVFIFLDVQSSDAVQVTPVAAPGAAGLLVGGRF